VRVSGHLAMIVRQPAPTRQRGGKGRADSGQAAETVELGQPTPARSAVAGRGTVVQLTNGMTRHDGHTVATARRRTSSHAFRMLGNAINSPERSRYVDCELCVKRRSTLRHLARGRLMAGLSSIGAARSALLSTPRLLLCVFAPLREIIPAVDPGSSLVELCFARPASASPHRRVSA